MPSPPLPFPDFPQYWGAPVCVFEGRAESIGPMWFQPKPKSKPEPGPGTDRLPLVGPGPRQKNASGGHVLLIVRDEFRTGYSLIGLLASRARLRFTGTASIKRWTAGPERIIIER